jgi:galactitol PTS system EIIC component
MIEIIETILNYKAYVMLPIIMFVLAVLIRMKFSTAFFSSIEIGIGFSVIYLAFNFLLSNIGPTVQELISARGLDFEVLDVGWPMLAAITWTTSIAAMTIPLFLAVNIIMLAVNQTETINIDIWNYWHISLLGALVMHTSGSVLFGYLSIALASVLVLKLADWSAPYLETEADMHGISITTITGIGVFPLGIAADCLIDRIPGLKKVTLNPEQIQKRFGFMGEPMFIGIFLGVLLGILAKFDMKRLLELSFHIATAMFILPMGAKLISSGLRPISLKLKGHVERVFPHKKNLRIGMSTFVLMKDSAVLVSGLILIPIALGIAFILPGNKMIPVGDLVNILAAIALIALAVRRNVFRAVLIGIPLIAGYLLIGTAMSPVFTKMAETFDLGLSYSYDGPISSFTEGGNPVRFYFVSLFRGDTAAFILLPAVLGLLYVTWRVSKKKAAADTLDGKGK